MHVEGLAWETLAPPTWPQAIFLVTPLSPAHPAHLVNLLPVLPEGKHHLVGGSLSLE